MRDISFWYELVEGSVNPSELEEKLIALSSCNFKTRLPFVGLIHEIFAQTDDLSVKRACLAAMKGSAGVLANLDSIGALSHKDRDIQLAALESLRGAAEHEPNRWIHTLFHHDREIRRLAVETAPNHLDPALFYYLYADKTLRELLVPKLSSPLVHEKAPRLFLDYATQGTIDDKEARRRIAELPWDRQTHLFLKTFQSERPQFGVGKNSSAPFVRLSKLKSALRQKDEFDRLIEVFLTAPGESEDPWTGVFVEKLTQSLVRHALKPTEQGRLAFSILEASLRKKLWNVSLLAISASVFPSLLLDPEIPVESRKMTARKLAEIKTQFTFDKLLDRFKDSDIITTGQNRLDLGVIAGLMAHLKKNPFVQLVDLASFDRIAEDFLADPDSAIPLLTVYPTSGADRSLRERLLKKLLKTSHGTSHVICALAQGIPTSDLEWLFGLVPDLASSFVETILDQIGEGLMEPSERRIVKICETLAPLLTQTASKLATALKTLARTPLGSDHPLAPELLGRLARRVEAETFVATLLKFPKSELKSLLDIELKSACFPFIHEQELVTALQKQGRAGFGSWIAAVSVPSTSEKKTTTQSWTSKDAQPLDQATIDHIATCGDDELESAISPCFEQLTSGLCDALRRRPAPSEPHPMVCAALLTTEDPPDLVADLFFLYSDEQKECLADVEVFMVRAFRTTFGLPLLGTSWLHRWETPHFMRLLEQLRDFQGGLASYLELGLQLGSPSLGIEIWKAGAKTLTWMKWRDRKALQEYTDERLFLLFVQVISPIHHQALSDRLGIRRTDHFGRFQVVAARILDSLNSGNIAPELIEMARNELTANLADIPKDILRELVRVLDTSGVVHRTKTVTKAEKISDGELLRLKKTTDLDLLTKACKSRDKDHVRIATSRLIAMGEPGLEALLQCIVDFPPPPLLRDLIETIATWPEGPSLDLVRQMVHEDGESPEIRFALALSLFKRGELTAYGAMIVAINAPAKHDWFEIRDWGALIDLGLDACQLAHDIAISPLFHAYSQAMEALLGSQPVGEKLVLEGLKRFLDADSERPWKLRVRVAKRLHEEGDLWAFPLLFSAHISSQKDQGGSRTLDLFEKTKGEHIIAATKAVLVAGRACYYGESNLLELLDESDSESIPKCYVLLLEWSTNLATQGFALDRIRGSRDRAKKLAELAEVFAWGVLRGRELTNKVFSIRMVGEEALGYTQLGTSKIFVNPLPLLRREREGKAVVRGLILHEIGHHLYHASQEALDLWKKAQKEHLTELFNLVLDEHLERNLRALDASYGDDLKVLDAYAFQYNNREIYGIYLLECLGSKAFDVLTSTPIEAARHPDCVKVNQGTILQAMERQGKSFARFIRALRMGLGNRQGDPKVGEGLTLFKKSFRRSSQEQLWEICLKLREIFGNETDILKSLGQQGLDEANASELLKEGEGLTESEVQREVERILNPRKRKSESANESKVDKLWINVNPDEQFEEIHTITPLAFNAQAYKKIADPVLRVSRHLRQYLMRLGLSHVTQRARIQGRHLDRGRLQSAVLRRDPRILISRKLAFKSDLHISVTVDCSGSMGAGSSMKMAHKFGALIAEAARGLDGVDARFFGFTDREIFDAGTADRCAIAGLYPHGGNNDAAALWHAAKESKKSRRSARLLVMISDGLPTECSVAALRALVRRLHGKNQTCCAQIAVAPLTDICFPHYVEISTMDEQIAVIRFGQTIARLVRSTLSTAGG